MAPGPWNIQVKGTVLVITSDLSFKELNARFTTAHFKPLSDQNKKDIATLSGLKNMYLNHFLYCFWSSNLPVILKETTIENNKSLNRCELDMTIYRFKVIFNYFYVKRRFLYKTKPNLEKDPKMPGVFGIHRWNLQDRSHHGRANQCFTSR